MKAGASNIKILSVKITNLCQLEKKSSNTFFLLCLSPFLFNKIKINHKQNRSHPYNLVEKDLRHNGSISKDREHRTKR